MKIVSYTAVDFMEKAALLILSQYLYDFCCRENGLHEN